MALDNLSLVNQQEVVCSVNLNLVNQLAVVFSANSKTTSNNKVVQDLEAVALVDSASKINQRHPALVDLDLTTLVAQVLDLVGASVRTNQTQAHLAQLAVDCSVVSRINNSSHLLVDLARAVVDSASVKAINSSSHNNNNSHPAASASVVV